MTTNAARNAARRMETAIHNLDECSILYDAAAFINPRKADKHAARADVWREKSWAAAAALDAEVGSSHWGWNRNKGTVYFN
jgi:hypothetical protein